MRAMKDIVRHDNGHYSKLLKRDIIKNKNMSPDSALKEETAWMADPLKSTNIASDRIMI